MASGGGPGELVVGIFGPLRPLFMAIRLVTFDALHTIITPRLPIHIQYSQTFAPYLGILEPDSIKRSFKVGTSKACQSSANIVSNRIQQH